MRFLCSASSGQSLAASVLFVPVVLLLIFGLYGGGFGLLATGGFALLADDRRDSAAARPVVRTAYNPPAACRTARGCERRLRVR